jgi:hypothetical protein
MHASAPAENCGGAEKSDDLLGNMPAGGPTSTFRLEGPRPIEPMDAGRVGDKDRIGAADEKPAFDDPDDAERGPRRQSLP